MSNRPLGRRVPTDWDHIAKYPLTAAPRDAITAPTPMVIGINWYTAMDQPVWKDGAYWVGLDPKNLGTIRGGHCVCVRPHGVTEPDAWRGWWDQVSEGICVGEGVTRAVAEVTRKRCQPRPLYDQAQQIDEYDDTPPAEGTSVRAGLNAALKYGLVTAKRGEAQALQTGTVTREPDLFPLTAYHWVTGGMDEVAQVLGLTGSHEYVVFVNSWGRAGYPHYTRMPLETLDRLRAEDGELGVPLFKTTTQEP